MLNKIFIDTLFVIAFVNPNDQYHKKACSLAQEYEKQHLVVTDVVLLEIGNGLSKNFKRQAIEIIEDFISSDDVEVVHLNPDLFQTGFGLYKKYKDKEWGLIDCISFTVMRQKKITKALTFDHHFTQAGFQALMRDE